MEDYSATSHAVMSAQVRAAPQLDIGIWHKRLGHLGEENIRKLVKMSNGMNIKTRTSMGVCGPSLDEKQIRQPSPNHLQGPRKHWSIVCLKNRSPTSAVKTTVHLMNSGTAAGGGVAGEIFSVARCRRLPENSIYRNSTLK